MKRKIIGFLLTLTLVMSLCSASSARVTIPFATSLYQFASSYTGQAPVNLADNVVGHYFEVPVGSLRSYAALCPSYSDNIGSITMTLYQWAGSYEETLSGEAISAKTFTDFNDNEPLTLTISKANYTGAFLVTFTNPVQQVGVWKVTANLNENLASKLFVNGTEHDSTALNAYIQTTNAFDVSEVERDTRDAYSRIQAEDFDEKSSSGLYVADNNVLVVNASYTGTGYADIDFGTTSPLGINMSVYPQSCNEGDSGEIHVMLDDPLFGTKIAEIYFEYKDMIPQWETIPCNIDTDIKGTHDIYLVFYGAVFRVDWFQFTKTAAGTSYYDDRLANFVPVEDSELLYHYSDTWSATDMMGRKLPGYETVGERDAERQVGLFYWTWHVRPHMGVTNGQGFNNNQRDIKNYIRTTGGTEADIKNVYSHQVWSGRVGHNYWNESVYGYYHGLDSWVMRKQLELFAAAGIDCLYTDCTNGNYTWMASYLAMAKTIHEMKQVGIQTPGVSCILPFSTNANVTEDLRKLYQTMYGTGLYSDAWYYWDGKPVIMGYPEHLRADTGYEDINALNDEIYDFFTFRPSQASYFTGPTRADHWPWLEAYPQHGFIPLEDSKYDYECVAVGVAQNANDNGLTAMNGDGVYGRSYTYKDRFSLISEESKYYGYNFAEQWERAYELNPKMVFITGWNEWIAGHYTEWMGVAGAFPDQYNDEYSRDIEPTKGDFKDNYYYQMVAGIRKFKGVSETPVASEETTIRLGGAFSQWDAVEPTFYGYAGGTETRLFNSVGQHQSYYNDTGRNDIVLSKVARDADYLYFYVKTSENITEHTDESWMRLFINTDRTYKTGWEGYDFAVNINNPSSSTSAELSYSADGWNWQKVGDITYKYSSNQMMMRIPREMIGLEDKIVDIEFKWIDNMQNQGDIMDVYNNGDSAPIGRFAYRYTETTENDVTPADEPVTVSKLKTNQHKHSVIMAVDSTVAFAGGKQLALDVAPQLINEKTMIPLRFFSESFGAEVQWNDKTRTATVKMDGNTVEITVGKSTMTANGESVALESPAVIQNGRILIPMRDLSENLGKQVLWVDGGLIIAGSNPETVHSYEWVGDMTEDHYGIR